LGQFRPSGPSNELDPTASPPKSRSPLMRCLRLIGAAFGLLAGVAGCRNAEPPAALRALFEDQALASPVSTPAMLTLSRGAVASPVKQEPSVCGEGMALVE